MPPQGASGLSQECRVLTLVQGSSAVRRENTFTIIMTKQTEAEYEADLISRGKRQVESRIQENLAKGYYSGTQQGRYTFHQYVDRLALILREVTDKAHEGLILRTNISSCCVEVKHYIQFLDLGAYHLATITLKALLDAYSRSKTIAKVQDIAGAIGSRIEDAIYFEFEQRRLDPADAANMRREASMPGSNPHYRKRGAKAVAKKALQKKGLKPLDAWSSTHRMKIGLYMLEVAREAGIVPWENSIKYGKNQTIVYSDQFMNDMLGNEELVLSRAFHAYPLIDQPLDWIGEVRPSRRNTSGGYHLPQLRRNQAMCRSFDSDSVFGDKAVDLLNTLQKTAWRIDSRILEVAQHLNEHRIPMKSFLVSTIDKPVKGEGYSQKIAEDPQALKEWKKRRRDDYASYHQQTTKAYRTRQTLSIAKEFEFKTFYLSWSLDWRGRYYPQQAWLTPQSTDFEKSLLKFRDGCKLDEESMNWCRRAIGAAYNGTRTSFAERARWTTRNMDLVTRAAQDPLGTIQEWGDAKEPWQFLQLCMEWHDVVTTGKEKFWKVPIGADSTASGLQLLSAMRRDPVGMKHANLLAPESLIAPPEDAYMAVLEAARGIASNDPELRHLDPYLKYRSIGKPAVMLSVYGGCHRNIKEDLEDAVDEIKDELKRYGVEVDKADMSKLTSLITKASKKVFPAAYEALNWLKRLAKSAHLKGAESLNWTTPTNDEIHLVKHQIDTIKIYTAFNGTVTIGDFNSEKPDLTRQVSSFAPSFVHCYDAALLKESFSDWTHPLALIHDCIRVLPSDMDRALDRIRDGFTSIVSGDPLARLADDIGVSNEELKRLPQLNQDLASVKESKYMFN